MSSAKHIKHYLIWHMIAPEVVALIDCEEQEQITEVILKMIRKTNCTWPEIRLGFTYVEALSLRSTH
jgi:hypothetical protein